tara:strand:+ start:525 stop:848 length:324 start_codon:yes stop_codon:yes gene_type:complete
MIEELVQTVSWHRKPLLPNYLHILPLSNRITVRNFITVATISVFLFMILYAVIENPLVLDNPLVTFVLGTFAPIVMMVYTFYYRKNKTKPEWDERIDASCPCCGKSI